ncbi:hypothetical protein GDO78_012378 [Eleutherodactylus coqui]|uniref:Uncharacterized protein n=1 Tax=Eleutherodactylus coqui TaxID=57060 RepID=A0A8J6F147_ELECQ|nr:hypothetical protein GDO78_012378 [Eleutherodactylus coqui]
MFSFFRSGSFQSIAECTYEISVIHMGDNPLAKCNIQDRIKTGGGKLVKENMVEPHVTCYQRWPVWGSLYQGCGSYDANGFKRVQHACLAASLSLAG